MPCAPQVADSCCAHAPVTITAPDAQASHVTLRIFKPFFTTKGALGTGLGMWISHEIVTRHIGKVTIRTTQRKPNSGTVINVLLPFEAGTREADRITQAA
jgi:nitrogen-specific signal transduction histidine kinase